MNFGQQADHFFKLGSHRPQLDIDWGDLSFGPLALIGKRLETSSAGNRSRASDDAFQMGLHNRSPFIHRYTYRLPKQEILLTGLLAKTFLNDR